MTEEQVEAGRQLARKLGVDEVEFLEIMESSRELAGWIVGRSPRPEDTMRVLQRRIPQLRSVEVDVEWFPTAEVEA